MCIQGGGGQECPDIEFEYADNDKHTNEIAEIYTYTENAEMNINMKAYDNLMFRNPYGGGPCWQKLNREQRCAFIMRLLDSLESSQKSIRMRALRCILYLAQVRILHISKSKIVIVMRFESCL